ncbi:MAG TPA: helix-turn-helix domain-containing protein [Ktedonobacteraceae bacterium]|jgi:transposase|nr:helix-turn-helix domain-containing protein [Ktedonobacteraceae bacterium]
MPGCKHLLLSEAQIQELTRTRDQHPKPHLRTKAAALLKVWQADSIRHVARTGLLKPVCAETICEWIKRYQRQGLDGWHIQPGRGRKPVFSPSA